MSKLLNLSHATIDILRFLAFGQAFFVVVLSVWAIGRYLRKIIEADKDERALPAHIILIATSYVGLVIWACYEIYLHIGYPMTWRTPAGLFLFAMGDAALIFMMVHLSLRRMIVARMMAQAQKEAEEESKREKVSSERRLARMEQIGQITHDETMMLSEAVSNVGKKAEAAYKEANDVNGKIEKLHQATNDSLKGIHQDAVNAASTAKVVSDKADAIGEVGADTNERVRNIEEQK